MVSPAKGPNGGFYIETKSKDLPLIEIVNAIDGEDLFFALRPACPYESSCAGGPEYQELL